MTTEEKKRLLLKDLYMRIPYGFTVHRYSDGRDIAFGENELDEFSHFLEYSEGKEFKPYLRSMSSMTEEEKYIYRHMLGATLNSEGESIMFVYVEDFPAVIDWLLENRFDFRGLIEMGLAIEEPDDMYKK